jgi:hypothetical protein
MEEITTKWDPALASLVFEEYNKNKSGLTHADFKRIASEHAIRFDDIMVTMFELVLAGKWQYHDSGNVVRLITRDEVDKLFVGGRIHEKDAAVFDGSWHALEK